MQVTPEERYWLADDWPRLRRTLARLIEPLLDAACNDMAATGTISDQNWKVLMDQATSAIAARDLENPLHATALAMLADGAILRRALVESLGRLDHD
ncbi:MAG: hypothetical protein RIQ46_148, partial [Pseudomonadota bacterium]